MTAKKISLKSIFTVALATFIIIFGTGCPFNPDKETHIYKQTQHGNLKLDIYYPKTSSFDKLPVLVYYHGGGFTRGSKQLSTDWITWDIMEKFLSNGYATASVEYTLVDKDLGTTMFDSITDSKDAIRWLRKEADTLGLDRNNIGVYGYSAGGQISQFIGLSDEDDFTGDESLSSFSSSVNYMLNLAGGGSRYKDEFDAITSWDQLSAEQIERAEKKMYKIGASMEDDIEHFKNLMKQLSTDRYIDSLDPPVATLHGTNDAIVDISESERLHAKLDEYSVNNLFYRLERYRHGFGRTMPYRERIPYVDDLYEFASSYYK